MSYDLARANAIETNDLVRKSAYSFEIINNKMSVIKFNQTLKSSKLLSVFCLLI